MLSIIVLGLTVALAAAVGLAVLALVDVAFRGPRAAFAVQTVATHGGRVLAQRRGAGGVADEAESQCPTCRYHMIGVTPPEALAIADTLRRTQPRDEVRRIRELAAINVQRAAGLDRERYAAAKIACPLVAGDDSCAAFGARPLHCRGWCLHSGEHGNRCLMADTDAEKGIVCGLNAAGLEADVYELNSALTAALDTPDAARRWGQAQAVFAGCKRYD